MFAKLTVHDTDLMVVSDKANQPSQPSNEQPCQASFLMRYYIKSGLRGQDLNL